MAESADAFKLFVDFMRDGSTEDRVKAAKGLQKVAETIGQERVNAELLPFLSDFLDEHDEILLAFAENLKCCLEAVGGPENVGKIFELLEKLCETEETVVRDGAVESLCSLTSEITPAQVDALLIPLIGRLQTADWFTGRVSACGLIATAYTASEEEESKTELIANFGALCKDETPMVRRAAASALEDIFNATRVVDKATDAMPLFLSLCSDNTDSVRIIAVQAAAQAAIALSVDEVDAKLCPLVKKWVEDKSWRIRKAIAATIFPICEKLGAERTTASMLVLLPALLTDPEREVKTVACGDLPKFCSMVGPDVFGPVVLSPLESLLKDDSPNVRTAATIATLGMLTQMPDELTEQVVKLIADEATEIRRNIVATGTPALCEVLTPEQLKQSVLPALQQCVDDKQWLVRAAFVQQLPGLTKKLGFQFFKDQFLDSYVKLCADKVACVRLAAVDVVADIAPATDFISSQLVPRLLKLYAPSKFFKNRVIVLEFAEKIARTDKSATEKLLPFLVECLSHPVPNVRFLACDAINAARGLMKKADLHKAATEIRPKVVDLLTDDDPDVVESVNRVIATYKWVIQTEDPEENAAAAVKAAEAETA